MTDKDATMDRLVELVGKLTDDPSVSLKIDWNAVRAEAEREAGKGFLHSVTTITEEMIAFVEWHNARQDITPSGHCVYVSFDEWLNAIRPWAQRPVECVVTYSEVEAALAAMKD